MQAIPEAVRTLLASRSMIGSNAPTAMVRVNQDLNLATNWPQAEGFASTPGASAFEACLSATDPTLCVSISADVAGTDPDATVSYTLRSWRVSYYGMTPTARLLDSLTTEAFTGVDDTYGNNYIPMSCCISPSGKWVVMTAYAYKTATLALSDKLARVYAFNATTGEFGALTHDATLWETDCEPSTCLFHPSGNFLAVSQASIEGESPKCFQLFAFNDATGQVGAVTDGHTNVSGVSTATEMEWSPDSRFLAIQTSSRAKVYPVDYGTGAISAGTTAPTPSTYRSTTGLGKKDRVTWHPTGRWIALAGAATGSPNQQTCVHPFDPDTLTIGARLTYNLTTGGDYPYETKNIQWSPDGNYLLVMGQNNAIMVAWMVIYGNGTAALANGFTLTVSGDGSGFYWDSVFPFTSDIDTMLAWGDSGPLVVKFGSYLSVQPSNLSIDREQAATSQVAEVSWPNVNPADPTDAGYYSPDRGDDVPADLNDWHQILFPGVPVDIMLGYGENLTRVFKGQADDILLDVNGAQYNIVLNCRDDAWNLLDKTITDDDGNYTITYTDTALEDIVQDLLYRAGVEWTNISIEATGITIAEKTFERMTYADGVAWCQTVSGFELTCDENGMWSFHYPTDRQPQSTDEPITLTGTDWTNLSHDYVVSGSDVVCSALSGGGTTYSNTLDYEIELGSPARIRRRAGTNIPDGATVYVTYVYAAWSFQEGVDLFRLPYRISRRDIYGKIIVNGKDSNDNVLTGTYTYSGSTTYGVPADKVLFVSMPDLDTTAKCQATADHLGHDMITKLRETGFAAVGNPWIQVGDCVRVQESATTISEIYRITSLSHSMGPSGFITTFSAYHYGYTPL